VVALEDELARYTGVLGGVLTERPRIVALNKMDVPDARDLADMVSGELVERFGWPVFEISTATREGLRELTFAMAEQVRAHRAAQPVAEATRLVLRPTAVDDAGFTVARDPELPGGFLVRGARPERWIRQTNFDNDEAVGYLGDRLARLGVEEALAQAGAVPGCPVTIGDVTFDWEPSTPAGVAVMLSGRGTDRRLEQNDRARAADRLAARIDRRRQRSDEELLADAGPREDDA
jgi:GTP-binding protein